MEGNAALRELTGRGTGPVVDLAHPGDDPGLRALLRQSVMPGNVRVALTREPDFFAADGMAGAEDVTLVAKHGGTIVGMGRMSVLRLFRNGTVAHIGYLGALRVAPGTRESPRLICAGYAMLAREAPQMDACFTSIASDNLRARRVLEHGARFGIPAYRALGELVTLVAPVPRVRSTRSERTSRDELSAFLATEAARSQLTLPWDDRLWADLRRHGVSPADFVVVRQGGNIVAAAAVWDQRAFRQVVVDGYQGAPGNSRPLANVLLRLTGRPTLPPPGSILASGTLFGAFVREPGHWPALWAMVQARAASMGLSWVTIARDERDRELPVLRRMTRAKEYHTLLYDVALRPDMALPAYDSRSFLPEVALL